MPKKVNKEFEFPFSKWGLLDYPDHSLKVWKKYYEFKEDLKIVDYTRGRSSVKIVLMSSKDGQIYPMFISDFTEMIDKITVSNGAIYGQTWGFVKKGANYGIYMLEPEIKE